MLTPFTVHNCLQGIGPDVLREDIQCLLARAILGAISGAQDIDAKGLLIIEMPGLATKVKQQMDKEQNPCHGPVGSQ